jgi:tRNA (cmo5U34)-methyltransferase
VKRLPNATLTNDPQTRRNASSLGHMPGSQWIFDESVTAVFADMLSRSIPQIDAMRECVSRAAIRFVQQDTAIVDLGCALGDAIAPLVDKFGGCNRLLGIEISEPMLAACRHRFRSEIEGGRVDIQKGDLRIQYPDVSASVTLCILTLMFTPIEHRFRIVADAFKHTAPFGVFILVEKILGCDAGMDTLFSQLYDEHKLAAGYTRQEVDQKRLSLEGVLVPITADWNEGLLRGAGFQHVECFWRCLNFAGWLAIKNQ